MDGQHGSAGNGKPLAVAAASASTADCCCLSACLSSALRRRGGGERAEKPTEKLSHGARRRQRRRSWRVEGAAACGGGSFSSVTGEQGCAFFFTSGQFCTVKNCDGEKVAQPLLTAMCAIIAYLVTYLRRGGWRARV